MPVPVDVIAGEVIEADWGNDIRDWAVGLVSFGGVAEATADASVTSTFENGANVTFTKPVLWTAYTIMAWGSVTGRQNTATSVGFQARISIDGNTSGTATSSDSAVNGSALTTPAFHSRTGLTGNAACIIQYRATSGAPTKNSSTVQYIAIRTS